MTITDERPQAPGERATALSGYRWVFFVALIAGTLLGAVVALGAPVLSSSSAAASGEMEELAAEFGVTIEWTDSDHPTSPGVGSFNPETPDLIYVSSDLDDDAMRHIILHTAAHALQYRVGAELNDCAAEDFAHAMGSTYSAHSECL